MGYTYIASIHADALDEAKNEKVRPQLACDLGEALVKLCVDPSYYFGSLSHKRRINHDLGHSGGAVRYCGEQHGTDEQVYAWTGNGLARIQDLHPLAFEEIERLVQEERDRRAKIGS